MFWLIVLSLVYMVLITIIYFSKESVENEDNKIYKKILIVGILGLLIDLIQYNSIRFGVNEVFIQLMSRLFLIYIDVWTYLFSKYLIGKNQKHKKKFEIVINLTVLIAGLVSLFLPLHYFYDGIDVMYTYGSAVNFMFGVGSFYMIVCSISIGLDLIINHNRNIKQYIPFIIFLIGGILEIVVQRANPALIIVSSVETFITILMYFFIENPDVKLINQLEIAKETADKANDSKTEFLSSMSHEIRTPLNAIVGFSDCIVDAKSLEEAKENAKDIVNASQTLLEIVNGILDISKIEAGKMEIVNTKYNAKETFTELAKLITPRMKEKGLDFSYFIDPNLPATLFGDKANIKKIVTNFLSNACKYTDKGFVRYEVHCVRLGDYCRLIISVEDSGRGIKKSSVDKLFTRFQRLDEDRNTTIEGTGLGLAITKQLTELMGGKVIVHTVYGQGSKFTAVINQKIETMDAADEADLHADLDFSGVRILIVDDAPLNLKVATKLFQKYHADTIETCSSGFECLEKIRVGNEYDLLFLDDMMPKMSGVETFSKLKQIDGFHIPTIALTANAITGMREKYLSIGFDDYLAKPMEQMELIRACNRLLGRSGNAVVEEVKEENDEESELEKTQIIPVEENIEEIIGDAANLDGNFKSDVSNHEEIEILDDFESVNASVVDLLPVADIQIPTTEPSSEVYDRAYLEKNGADINHALELLGDMDMYNMTISDFASEIDEKWQRIHDYLEKGDMENYAIDVHSLKSDCKYLGFMGLADIAYDHELKSKEKNVDYVREHFKELEEEYYRVIDVIKNYVSHNKVEEE